MSENSTETLKKLIFGDNDPIESTFEALVDNKEKLPEQFIINSEYNISIDEPEFREFILDSLMTVFCAKEEYLKCEEVKLIQDKLKEV